MRPPGAEGEVHLKIRIIDCGPLDGVEREIPEAMDVFRVPTLWDPLAAGDVLSDRIEERRYVRVGFAPARRDEKGKVVWGDAVIYMWDKLLEWWKKEEA